MIPGLTLKLFGGEDIATVSAEAQRIADRIERAVGFEFNSVRCVAVPGGCAKRLAQAQQDAQRSSPVVHSDTCEITFEDRQS